MQRVAKCKSRSCRQPVRAAAPAGSSSAGTELGRSRCMSIALIGEIPSLPGRQGCGATKHNQLTGTCTGAAPPCAYDFGFVGPVPDSGPVPRICTKRCNVSNQKGAPNSVASIVSIHPGTAWSKAVTV
jgi:hypothetical protein